ncbi:MAG TPA: phosphodiester glycosidase family protein [Candidatus Sulfotelmatobacter sp.]|nr:phosphodiester glycosidase family protein [Candidatus Sulfotelmatobacter sp.]
MIALPATLAPPAPFPPIVAQHAHSEAVAPGIVRADYRLTTSDGPLIVHAVAVDLREPSVRLRVVVAHDRLVSSGETVSSMAVRTGAVAGVNADYFDIGQTNQPLNAVVQDGALVRTPSARAVLSVARDGSVSFGTLGFAGTASYGATRVPLTGVNVWPPEGGAALIDAAFGPLTAAPGVTVAALTPLDGVAGAPGTYRVTAVGPAAAGPANGTLLALGPAALRSGAPPAVGDTVAIAYDTTPPLATVSAAVGGGPLLVAGGAPVDDPNAPAPEERNVRFPVSGAAVTAGDTLLLLAVDGRIPALSIGLTRPQFAALMLGFGALDGMAFDSGGSATLVARVLGDAQSSVLNTPSDGEERLVADGLFVYSDAPGGGASHLIVRPTGFAALPGAVVALRGAVVDASDHRLHGATLAPLHVDAAPGAHVAVVADRDGLRAEVPYTTLARAATLAVTPERPDPDPHATVALSVRALDANGDPVVLGPDVRWRADGGTLAPDGADAVYRAGTRDAHVTVAAGGVETSVLVHVGRHEAALPEFAAEPLTYDFTGNARVARDAVAVTLPGEPIAVSLEVRGNGDGVPLRATFVNRFGELRALTLAAHVDWTGWRRVTLVLPPDLNPPVRLTSLYVVPSLGGPPVHSTGTLAFRTLTVTLPGSP